MGGQAFQDIMSPTPIQVPRMPPELYHRLSKDISTILTDLFGAVTVPREAPGKQDYGDIDFLVSDLRSPDSNDIWATLKEHLHADYVVSHGSSHSFAVPHPNITGSYVQIDVELSPGSGTPLSAELFEWTKFMKADADLVQIIGVCHRPLGLTCNDRGLHVRVEQIEPYNKKKALLFLTRDPVKAMEFYGLDANKYWKGFRDEAELFEWVSRGRFFAWEIFDKRVEKANDRARQNKRGMFRRFVEDYMPAHPDAAKDETWTRQQVLDEALTHFGKHEEYRVMIVEHKAKEAEEALWKQIRKILPLEGSSLGEALKGLKRWVDFDNGRPYITASPLLERTPVWTVLVPPERIPDTLEWVASHWQEAKALEKQRAKDAKAARSSTSVSV